MDLWRVIRGSPRLAAAGSSLFVVLVVVFAYISVAGCTEAEVNAGACIIWLQANPFWPSFYGNLMATIAGAALGFWVALDLDRRADAARQRAEREADERQRRARKAEEMDRRAVMLGLLDDEIGANQQLLHFAMGVIRSGRIQELTELSVTTHAWHALSNQVLPGLASDESGYGLARRLTRYYGTLQVAQSMVDAVIQIRHRYYLGPIRLMRSKQDLSSVESAMKIVIDSAPAFTPDLQKYILSCRERADTLRK